jgi:hypothetical protein
MTREEHNRAHGVNRQPDESVSCNLFGYAELTQYDGDCPACWLGHQHDWAEHDEWLRKARQQKKDWEQQQCSRLIDDACKAEELFSLDELEAFASSQGRAR